MDNQPEKSENDTAPIVDDQPIENTLEQPKQWQYNSGKLTDEQDVPEEEVAEDIVLAQWSASEFIHHDKSPQWYLFLVISVILTAIILFAITREIFPIIITIVLGIVFGMYAQAQPKTVSYTLSPKGITADDKHYLFTDFKSYSVIQETAMPYIQLLPRQRFMIALSIYVEPTQLSEIADKLGEFIPYDQRERDFVEKFAAKIRY